MKKKRFLLVFLLLFLLGCQNNPEEKDMGVFLLEYPEEVIKIEGEIGKNVIIPELIKDDYVFIGWTDGENYYAGLTEVIEESITLTPEYVSVESVFEEAEISMGQVTLKNYYGDSTIVGIPTYWRGYLVIGFTSQEDIITKLYVPSSIKSDHYYQHVTDFVVYGDFNGSLYERLLSEANLTNQISDCTYIDEPTTPIENVRSGVLNEECHIKAILERNDDEAVTVPGHGTYYTFDVVYESSLDEIAYRFYSDQLRYISLSQAPIAQLIMQPNLYGKEFLEILELPNVENERYIIEDNKFIIEEEDGDYLVFVFSNETNLELDLKDYLIYPEYFHVIGTFESIEIKNSEELYSSNGIVYFYNSIYTTTEGSPTEDDYMTLHIYPFAKEDTSFTFPENMKGISETVYNPHVETITINQYFTNIDLLKRYFPNLKNIHVPNNHPSFIEEDGVIYDIDKLHIYFVNESVQELVIKEGTEDIRTRIDEIDSIHIEEFVNLNFIYSLNSIGLINQLTIDENNPYIYIEDGVVYSKSTSQMLYIKSGIDDLVLKDNLEVLGNLFENKYLYDYIKIKSIHLNEHITVSDVRNLTYLSNLETITVDNNNPYITVLDNVVYTKDLTELLVIPKNTPNKTINIPETVNMIGLDVMNNGINVESFVVDENNQTFTSIDGIIHNKTLTRILFVPRNYKSSTYTMPDTLTDIFSISYMDISSIKTIYIGENYEFFYEKNGSHISVNLITQFFRYFDNVNIHPDSPYYNGDYNIITANEDTVLIGFVGEDKTYEIPDYIENINPYLFHDSLPIEHLTVTSGLLVLPEDLFTVESLKSITIKGNTLMQVEGFSTNDVKNELGDNYIYYFGSSDLIVYVEASMVNEYLSHPFWSLYDVRPMN